MSGNPYGITQVDVPGLLSMHQQMQASRLEQLYKRQTFELEHRKAEREDKREGLLARVFMGGQGEKTSEAPSAVAQAPVETAPVTAPQQATINPEDERAMREALGDDGYAKWAQTHGVGGVIEMPEGVTLPPIDQDLPPRTDGVTINQQALRELAASDPQAASQIQTFIYNSDKQGLERAAARGEAMAVAATNLGKVPPDQRAAAFEKWKPFLIERGYLPSQLARPDLSDNGLARYLAQGRKIESIISSNKDERDFAAQQAERTMDNVRADAALGIARNRESRIGAGKAGDDMSGASTDALLSAAGLR